MKTWTFEELYKPLSEEMLKRLSTRRLYNYYKKWRNLFFENRYYEYNCCSDSHEVVQQKIEDYRLLIKKMLKTREHINKRKADPIYE